MTTYHNDSARYEKDKANQTQTDISLFSNKLQRPRVEIEKELDELRAKIANIEGPKTREDLDTTPFVPTRGMASEYSPVVMCDQSVYDLAKLGLTQMDISAMFRVTRETMLDHHQYAFDLGKVHQKLKPRLVKQRFLEKLEENMDAGPIDECKTNGILLNLLALYEKHLPVEAPIATVEETTQKLSDEELKAQIRALALKL